MVYLHLGTGFEEIEALATLDILRRADIDVKTVSVMERKIVDGAHGVGITADLMFADADYDICEMIILPGGMPGAANLFAHKELGEQIARFKREGKWLAAICAAPAVVFGGLGILKGEAAVCYPSFEEDLAAAGAAVKSDKVCISGKVVTSRGPGTAFDFAFTLVELLSSKGKADEVKKGMLL